MCLITRLSLSMIQSSGSKWAVPLNTNIESEIPQAELYSGDNRPVMFSDSILGIVFGRPVSIPMSDAESEEASSSISTETVLLVAGIAGAIVLVTYVLVPELENLRHVHF